MGIFRSQIIQKRHMETKIASYQEPSIRLQLIKIFNRTKSVYGITTYQIRKNRKIICTFKWECPARQKFLKIIQNELLQTRMDYEEEQ